MKHLKKYNENKSDEHLLIVHHESGDEIHFSIINYSYYDRISDLLGTDPMRTPHSQIQEMLKLIYDNRDEHMVCQTYVLEDWIFSDYKIVKVINLPELGM